MAGEPPVRYDLGLGFETVDLAPGSVLLVGAPPAVGKTALVTQWVAEALARQLDLKALVCNVEMHPPRLLARMVARLGKVPMDALQRCDLSGRGVRAKVEKGLAAVAAFADRLAFVTEDGPGGLPPYSVENIKAAADAFGADLVVVDYLQRITSCADGGPARSDAAAMTRIMQEVRAIAARGVAVVVVSAVSRQKDTAGRTSYRGVNLASFRGSSEIEFGADDAYLLDRDDDLGADGRATLRHVKARYREPQDVALVFDGSTMTFGPPGGRGR
jgi:replicative DNA helicase